MTPAKTTTPVPGIYAVRLCRGCPRVPAKIIKERATDEDGRVLDRADRLVLLVAGVDRTADLARLWPWLAPMTPDEWAHLTKISAGLNPTQPIRAADAPPAF